MKKVRIKRKHFPKSGALAFAVSDSNFERNEEAKDEVRGCVTPCQLRYHCNATLDPLSVASPKASPAAPLKHWRTWCLLVVFSIGRFCADYRLQIFSRLPGLGRRKIYQNLEICTCNPHKKSAKTLKSAIVIRTKICTNLEICIRNPPKKPQKNLKSASTICTWISKSGAGFRSKSANAENYQNFVKHENLGQILQSAQEKCSQKWSLQIVFLVSRRRGRLRLIVVDQSNTTKKAIRQSGNNLDDLP